MYDLLVSHKLVSASLSLTRSVAHNFTPSVSFLLPLGEVSLSLAIYGLAFTHSRCSHFSVFSLSVFSLLCALALILSLSVFFCVFLLCVLVCSCSVFLCVSTHTASIQYSHAVFTHCSCRIFRGSFRIICAASYNPWLCMRLRFESVVCVN